MYQQKEQNMDDPSYRQRKAHTKSRHGCAQCKQRHYKCNEVHPQCGTCTRLNIECSFSSRSPSADKADDTPYLAIDDLELLHSWNMNSRTFPIDDGSFDKEHHDGVTRLGFTHHYVLHCILAISAFDLFYKDRSKLKWYEKGVSHQAAAIRLARPHLLYLSQEHASAMFVFSAFTSVTALAESILRPKTSKLYLNMDPIKELLHSFQLGRGIVAVMSKYPEHLKESGFIPKTKPVDDSDELVKTLEIDYPQVIVLRELVANRCNSIEANAWLEAVNNLFKYLSILMSDATKTDHIHLIQVWPMHVPSVCIEMCESQQPIALAILAHYAALMSLRPCVWFFRDWPAVLFNHIHHLLGHDWEQLLQWPRDIVFRQEAES